MAKKVSDDEKQTNTFDPKRVEKIVRKIEDEFEGLLSERMSYMSKCKPYRERIALAYEEGIGFDIPKKILKAKIKERALQRQIDGIPGDFEGDDHNTFEQLSQALGEYADTPLGKAAVNAAEKPAKAKRTVPAPIKGDDDDADLRPDSLKKREAERAAQANAEALEAGIQPLTH